MTTTPQISAKPGDIDKLKALALTAEHGGQHIYTNPRDSNKWRANEAWHREAGPEAFLALIAEVERLRARFEYIEDNATTSGGGNGFEVRFFVPVDDEDIGCGIDAAIAAHSKAGKPAQPKKETHD
jgi:hypothetical protein